MRPPSTATGWSLRCPVCWRLVLPADGSLHFAVAPRWAFHLWDEHPAEAAILRMHLFRPPERWPELVDGAEAITDAFQTVPA